jgi:hypothetical protein
MCSSPAEECSCRTTDRPFLKNCLLAVLSPEELERLAPHFQLAPFPMIIPSAVIEKA